MKKQLTESQFHPNDEFQKMVESWQAAYALTLKTEKQFRKRLHQLETWDTCNGRRIEHSAKVIALQNLIG
jgi:hypothetical protein